MKPENQTLSLWSDGAPEFPLTPLREDISADVCIVGAGIAGVTTALLLAREGRNVVLLDDGQPGGGQTCRTTAHLASAIDDRFYNIIRWHGLENARLAAESHATAINFIEALASDLAIDCDFRRLDGYLFPMGGEKPDLLDQELDAAHQAGLVDVTMVSHPEIPGVQMPGRALRFPRQAQFAPLRYLHGLLNEFTRLGGRFFGNTHVTGIEEGAIAHVTTAGNGLVRAAAIVVATNSPINNRVALHTKMGPYRTYVIALRVPHGRIAAGLYWDNDDPYHYVRLTPGADGHDELMVGGEDHKTGQGPDSPDGPFDRLERWARVHFPGAGAVTHRWSGQVMESIDGLAFIGRNPGSRENCYVVTGDSGMGMTHGTIAGIILNDLILGRPNPWAALYDPSRKTVSAGGTFAHETFNMARQYLDWARPHPREDLAEIPRGSGCVVQRGMEKVAIHRSNDGTLHEMSAVCPHLGCIVRWNSTEHTWDCPCHGSRFAHDGEVVNGPASHGLKPVHHHTSARAHAHD
jgi:glycine/D-amino acid oxidase-like deaminating enzyme/nitrite reductase/ring-hydroxylating ferredoxin subunit